MLLKANNGNEAADTDTTIPNPWLPTKSANCSEKQQ